MEPKIECPQQRVAGFDGHAQRLMGMCQKCPVTKSLTTEVTQKKSNSKGF